MKLVLDKKHGNKVEFIAKEVSTSFANMVRRYSMSYVSVLAIDSVTFYDNTTAFWDEYISHRLGLMPLATPENIPAGTEVIFSLDAEGPKVVYASDMVSSDKEISVAKGSIPVVTLGPNQRVRFEAKAILGTGKKHAKFQSGLVAYGAEGDDLKFMVESFFQMEPVEVLSRGCDSIEQAIEEIESALGKKPVKAEKPAKKKAEKKEKKEKKPKVEKGSEEKKD